MPKFEEKVRDFIGGRGPLVYGGIPGLVLVPEVDEPDRKRHRGLVQGTRAWLKAREGLWSATKCYSVIIGRGFSDMMGEVVRKYSPTNPANQLKPILSDDDDDDDDAAKEGDGVPPDETPNERTWMMWRGSKCERVVAASIRALLGNTYEFTESGIEMRTDSALIGASMDLTGAEKNKVGEGLPDFPVEIKYNVAPKRTNTPISVAWLMQLYIQCLVKRVNRALLFSFSAERVVIYFVEIDEVLLERYMEVLSRLATHVDSAMTEVFQREDELTPDLVEEIILKNSPSDMEWLSWNPEEFLESAQHDHLKMCAYYDRIPDVFPNPDVMKKIGSQVTEAEAAWASRVLGVGNSFRSAAKATMPRATIEMPVRFLPGEEIVVMRDTEVAIKEFMRPEQYTRNMGIVNEQIKKRGLDTVPDHEKMASKPHTDTDGGPRFF
jgi:hypothetical protein